MTLGGGSCSRQPITDYVFGNESVMRFRWFKFSFASPSIDGPLGICGDIAVSQIRVPVAHHPHPWGSWRVNCPGDISCRGFRLSVSAYITADNDFDDKLVIKALGVERCL